MESRGQGKRWAAALAVAQCLAENPGCRVAVIGQSYFEWRREGGEAELILAAIAKVDGGKAEWLAGRRSIKLGNGSRLDWYSGSDKYDQSGQRYQMAWLNNISRHSQRHREVLSTIGYNLDRRRFPTLGIVIETGDLTGDRYPELRDCDAWLLRAAEEFLELNAGWGTFWVVRDSDAEPTSIVFRWGEGEAECRALIAQLPGAPDPMYCVKWPGGNSHTWVGEPKRHPEFARSLHRYRWDDLPWLELEVATIGDKSASECVLLAEKIGGRQ